MKSFSFEVMTHAQLKHNQQITAHSRSRSKFPIYHALAPKESTNQISFFFADMTFVEQLFLVVTETYKLNG